MKLKLFYLIITTLMFLPFCLVSQENFKLETGFTLPEGYIIGVKYQYFSDLRIDFRYGTDFQFFDDDIYHSFVLNHAFYFGNTNNKIKHKLWTFNSGITFLYFNNNRKEGVVLRMSIYFAREFPITKRLFIQSELGVSYRVYDNRKIKDYEHIVNYYSLAPKLGLNLILKI